MAWIWREDVIMSYFMGTALLNRQCPRSVVLPPAARRSYLYDILGVIIVGRTVLPVFFENDFSPKY